MYKKFLLPVLVLILFSCSSKLNTKSNYSFSVDQYKKGKIEKALVEFPIYERGEFITTMEKC